MPNLLDDKKESQRLSVVYQALANIRPAKRNPRMHSPGQIEQIVRSIMAFGWTNPILVDEHGAIIAGHGRLEAARKLGMLEVPTISLAGLSEDERRALVIADNKLALNAGWDEELLALELGELGVAGFDVSLIGFSNGEMDQILAPHLDPASEWQGMPEFEQGDQQSFRSIIVHFLDQAAIDQFAATIGQSFTQKTKFTWFPQLKRENVADQRYIDDTARSDLHPIEGAA